MVCYADRMLPNARFLSALSLLFPVILSAATAESPLTDPNYQALRNDNVAGVFRVNNLTLTRDAGTFTFQSGSFSFGGPVLGKRVFAVFTGDGVFHLKAAAAIEADHLRNVTGAPEFEEPFHSAVFCFTDKTYDEIVAAATAADEAPTAARGAFQSFRSLVRARGDQPKGQIEALLGGEDIVNVDAELLRELYTGRESFAAYIHGQKHADLRFIVNPNGAIPQLSPEEVALIDPEPETDFEGILYSSHFVEELKKGSQDSMENRHQVSAESYRIETTIGSNNHLTATADIKMKVLTNGTRVVKFGLLPALRVESVKQGDTPIPFIQEGRYADGSFYVVFPAPMKAGSEAEVMVAYSGDKVVRDEGGGTFAVGARESWYPSLNAFADRAAYDLTFRVPKRYTLVSIGRQDKATVEKDTAVTHWVSEAALAVAGFNYGEFKKLAGKDDATGKQIEVYTTSEPPSYLRNEGILLDPNAMAKSAFVDAQNSVRVFESWFGKTPYSRIAITQQPQFSFGQSWPSLVYLPISAFLDTTQRYALLGSNAFKFAHFIDEVTPHEVSHQWWGHDIGWASYHDQWLSEGFATFSASLFLEATTKGNEEQDYWERERQRILAKNPFGKSPNDAGPLWLGQRLDSRKNEAYDALTYSKGAYILQMLRAMMWDPQTHDDDFMKMMKQLVSVGGGYNVSTEAFAILASKHVKPYMNLGGDNTLGWFFSEWVYGTDIPKYGFEYSLAPKDAGSVLTGHLTQSGVSDSFRMTVPLYVELASKQIVRIASVPVQGNNTKTFTINLPMKPVRVLVNANHDVLASDTTNKLMQ